MFGKKTLIILFILAVIVILVRYATVAEAGVVKKGLISYWTFDQSTIKKDKTVTVEDVFGDNDGTVTGKPEIIEGVIGEALHFNGVNDCVVVGSNESLKLIDAFTIETWVKGDAAPDNSGSIRQWLSKGANGSNYRFSWDGDDANVQSFAIGQIIGGWSLITNIKEGLKGEEWYHIVGTWDNRGLKVYLNGKLSNSKNWRATPVTDDEPLRIGGSTSSFFHGAVDEVKIYNRALTEEEILNNFQDRFQLSVTRVERKIPTLWCKIKRIFLDVE